MSKIESIKWDNIKKTYQARYEDDNITLIKNLCN